MEEQIQTTKKKGIVEDEKAESLRRNQLVSAARIRSIEREQANKDRLYSQRVLTEIQRTEMAKKRAAQAGVYGQHAYRQSLLFTNKTLFNQNVLLSQLSTSMGAYLSVYRLGAFVKELAMISGEFEKQRLSLAAILQDDVASTRIFKQIRDLAVYSPFNFSELIDFSKMLSAYSVPANELFETMKRLADVSAGLGVDMRRIILAYGQVRSAAVLRGQELRQFTEAGIPLVEELAKKFTALNGELVTTGDVFDKISNREVPFKMIKDIFEEMTNEGGKFYQMQEIQATSLAGMISNLRDAYDIMLISIGDANSDMMKGFVSGLVDVMDNWEKYWRILKTIIVGYGAYKAAVIASTVVNRSLIKTIEALIILQTRFNFLTKANVYGLALSGIAMLITGLMSFIDTQNDANNKILESVSLINNQKESVNKLIDRLKELTNANSEDKQAEAERESIIKSLLEKEPKLAKAIKEHADNLEYLIDAQKRYNDLMDSRKFAIYAIAETKGFLKDGVADKLTRLDTAQNKADMSAVKLEMTYHRLVETMQKVNDKGGFENKVFGLIPISEERQQQINDILNSEKTHADKVLEVYKLIQHVERARYRTNNPKGIIGDANLYNHIFSGDHKDKIKDYSASIWNMSSLTQELDKDLTDLAGTLEINFRNKNIDVFDEKNESMLRNYVKSLEDLTEHGQKTILAKWNIEFEVEGEADEKLDGWRKEVNEKLNSEKNVISINIETDMNSLIDDMKKEFKTISERLTEQRKFLIRLGFDFDKDLFPDSVEVTKAMEKLLENFKIDEIKKKQLIEGAKSLGIDPMELFTPKDKSGQKDKFTDELKRQVELVRDAKKQYDSLRKIMSKDDALRQVTTIDEYKHIDGKYLSDEGFVDYLKEQLTKIEKRNTDTAKNTRVTWNKELGNIQIDLLRKQAEKELNKIEKYLSQYKDKYNFYEQIYGLTGDKSKAAELAFGDPTATIESYIDIMKAKLKEMSGGVAFEGLVDADRTQLPDAVRKLVEEIEKAIDDRDFTLKLDMSKLIADYATTQEKITAIHDRYERERERVRNSSLTDTEKEKGLDAIDRAEFDAVKDLKTELWQLHPFYQQLFGDLSEIGYRHLKDLTKRAKETVDLITNTRIDENTLKYGKYDKNGKILGYFLPDENGDLTDTFIHLKEFERILKKITELQKQMRNYNPFDSLLRGKGDYNEEMTNLDILASKAKDLNTIVKELGGSLSEMFDAFGNESAADTTQFITELAGSASTIAKGIASSNPVQVIEGVVNGITSIARHHDKKLDRAIRRSQLEVKKLKNAYTDLERYLSRQLGAITQKQAGEQLKNLEKQRQEIENQLRKELKKKKTDHNVVEDYKGQINELNDQIRYFYEDLAGEQFGIKIKDWAKTIADSLVDAWSKGEDAAEAFDKTVADIMKNVFKSVLQLQYIEPAMKQLREYLFGNDGKGGILGDGELSQRDMIGLVGELANLKNNIGKWQKAWDNLVKAAAQAGIDLQEKTSSSEDTLSKGIQAVTEDTANLIASYINAMRADLSVQRNMVERLLIIAESNTSMFALMQADIMRIQINTLATANNTSRLVELSEGTYGILRNATVSGSGIRFNMA